MIPNDEEICDSTLRAYLDIADRAKKESLISDYGGKLDNYRKAKDRLNNFYDLIAKIQIDGLFNDIRAATARKIINLLTELVNIQKEKLLNDFILS